MARRPVPFAVHPNSWHQRYVLEAPPLSLTHSLSTLSFRLRSLEFPLSFFRRSIPLTFLDPPGQKVRPRSGLVGVWRPHLPNAPPAISLPRRRRR